MGLQREKINRLVGITSGVSTAEGGRGHATQHLPNVLIEIHEIPDVLKSDTDFPQFTEYFIFVFRNL